MNKLLLFATLVVSLMSPHSNSCECHLHHIKGEPCNCEDCIECIYCLPEVTPYCDADFNPHC